MAVTKMMKRAIKQRKILLSALATALLAGTASHNDADAQNRTEHVFEGWRVVCNQSGENLSGEAEGDMRCRMVQTLIHSESRREVFRWAIVSNEENQLTSVLSAPLGVQLQPGLELTVAGADPISVSYDMCNRRWCFARQPMSEELRSQLSAEEPVEVTYVSPRGQRMRMEAAMGGFSEALDFMETQISR